MKVLVTLVLFAVGASAQNRGAMPVDREGAVQDASKYIGNPEAIKEGGEHYLTLCSGCHGPHAEGGRGANLVQGRNVRRASDADLFKAIQKGIPGTDMPPFPLPDETIWQMVAFLRSLTSPAYLADVPGDPEAGKAVFFGKGGCTECHTIRGKGGFLGPDLTTAGATNTLLQLEEAVSQPKLRVKDGFRSVIVTTADGHKIKGVAKNNSNYSIQVLDGEGNLHLFDKRDLRKVEFPRESWMPADFAERLSKEEMQNLLAFLSRQTARSPSKGSSP